MSTISTCPRCSRIIAIPSGLEATNLVRCPLCGGEYPLSEALELVPPELIPVGAPDTAILSDSMQPISGPEELEVGIIGIESEESPLDAEVLSMLRTEDKAGQESPHQSEPLSLRGPSQRKPKNVLRIFLEIVLGGVVGIGIAYVALAWIMGSRFDLPRPPKVTKPVLRFVLPDRIWNKD